MKHLHVYIFHQYFIALLSAFELSLLIKSAIQISFYMYIIILYYIILYYIILYYIILLYCYIITLYCYVILLRCSVS